MSGAVNAIEQLVGMPGLYTHQIPNAITALRPFLRSRCKDPEYWATKYDETQPDDDIEIEPLSDEERLSFLEAYEALPDPFTGKVREYYVTTPQ